LKKKNKETTEGARRQKTATLGLFVSFSSQPNSKTHGVG